MRKCKKLLKELNRVKVIKKLYHIYKFKLSR